MNEMEPVEPSIKKVFGFLAEAEPEADIPRCDGIFVFGTTAGDVAKYAAHLYAIGKAPRMVISGLHGHDKAEGPFGFGSEAEYLASVAEKEGVPKGDILLETKAKNTYENVIFGMKACEEDGFFPESLVLVGIPYLLRRARRCFEKNFPGVKLYGAAMPVDASFFTPHRIERIKGELPRLVKYAKEGTIAPSVIPKEIKEAAARFP